MAITHTNAFVDLFDIVEGQACASEGDGMLFAFGVDGDGCVCGDVFGRDVGAFGGETRTHDVSTGEHEFDGTAVDLVSDHHVWI